MEMTNDENNIYEKIFHIYKMEVANAIGGEISSAPTSLASSPRLVLGEGLYTITNEERILIIRELLRLLDPKSRMSLIDEINLIYQRPAPTTPWWIWICVLLLTIAIFAIIFYGIYRGFFKTKCNMKTCPEPPVATICEQPIQTPIIGYVAKSAPETVVELPPAHNPLVIERLVNVPISSVALSGALSSAQSTPLPPQQNTVKAKPVKKQTRTTNSNGKKRTEDVNKLLAGLGISIGNLGKK
jgi:hypothetical protein